MYVNGFHPAAGLLLQQVLPNILEQNGLFFPALLLLSHRLNQPGHPAGQPAQNLLLLFCKRCQCEAGRILIRRTSG